jgi:alpha-L-arabinofuranosidase
MKRAPMKAGAATLGKLARLTAIVSLSVAILPGATHAQGASGSNAPPGGLSATVTVLGERSGKPISPDLFGIFFEDINYGADGGLYAELIQNGAFEYSAADRSDWNSLTAWEGAARIETNQPVNPNTPHYAVVAGMLKNSGFDGIPVKAGEKYNLSLFARGDDAGPIRVRLESKTGTPYGETTIAGVTRTWAKLSGTIQADSTDADARLSVTPTGSVCLDMISLFPQKTFHGHRLRADLAQVIADLKPKFMRFPGGWVALGDGLANMYRWKDTIGPVEQRRQQRNIWGYHQSVGLGYFEYFQFCEDIGAKPLPVVPAGVCCQNSGPAGDPGQKGLPLDKMPEYIQEVLDLIEWANGPATSKWGAKRAAAGHPKPFHLEFLGVGNDDAQTPVFRERFKMIYDALKKNHPEITVIGTVGPGPAGQDFDAGWTFANEIRVPMVDEHYYEMPGWFLTNLNRYDSYNRSRSKVYVGEYASRGNGLLDALAEAAYMTSLERNGDVVRMASYAPLLGRIGHTQWNPDLIYFTGTTVEPTVNYYVQQMFSCNQGDVSLPVTVTSNITGPRPTGVMLGTWDTQAQFADVTVTTESDSPVHERFEPVPKDWSTESGAWAASDGVYAQTADGQPALSRFTFATSKPGYTYSLKAQKTGGKEGFLIGFEAVDRDHYYWWNLGGWGNRLHGIEKIGGGSKSLIGKEVPGHIESDRWYDIRIEVDDHRIRCYLDNVLVHDVDEVKEPTLAASCVKDTSTGDTILKLVNMNSALVPIQVNFQDAIHPGATRTILVGDPTAHNKITPQTGPFTIAKSFTYDAPANSLTVLRMTTR